MFFFSSSITVNALFLLSALCLCLSLSLSLSLLCIEKVVISGTANAQYNDKIGIVTSYDLQRRRYLVKIYNGDANGVLLRPANLRLYATF